MPGPYLLELCPEPQQLLQMFLKDAIFSQVLGVSALLLIYSPQWDRRG